MRPLKKGGGGAGGEPGGLNARGGGANQDRAAPRTQHNPHAHTCAASLQQPARQLVYMLRPAFHNAGHTGTALTAMQPPVLRKPRASQPLHASMIQYLTTSGMHPRCCASTCMHEGVYRSKRRASSRALTIVMPAETRQISITPTDTAIGNAGTVNRAEGEECREAADQGAGYPSCWPAV